MEKIQQALIVGNDIRCPLCGRKWGAISGKETIINYKARCPRTIHGKCHWFIVNVNDKMGG